MNAEKLFTENGKFAGVYYCGKCNIVHRGKVAADECCKDWRCKRCNVECDKFRTLCKDCWHLDRNEKDAAVMEKAELVEGYNGFVHSLKLAGPQDGYFPDLDELIEYCETHDIEPPEFVHCCKPTVLCVHVSDILERLEDNGYEEMTEHAVGVDELRDAVAAFNEANRQTFTVWNVDYTRKVAVAASVH